MVVPSLFFGFFTWLSFLILGLRARRRDWTIIATAYGVYSAVAFFALGRPEVDGDDTANVLIGMAILLAWFGGALHTGVVYYRFANQPGVAGAAPDLGIRRRRRGDTGVPAGPAAPAADDLGLGLGDPASEYLATAYATPSVGRAAPVEAPVEANTAGQRTLTRLPGVTPALARRWVAERRRRGGFRDIDDLATALDLQPHEIVRLRPRLSFTAPGAGGLRRRPPGADQGRVLDV